MCESVELLSIDLPCDHNAPAAARRALGEVAPLRARLDDGLLVASELVTNAVLHSGCETGHRIQVRAAALSDALLISVHDPGISRQTAAPRATPGPSAAQVPLKQAPEISDAPQTVSQASAPAEPPGARPVKEPSLRPGEDTSLRPGEDTSLRPGEDRSVRPVDDRSSLLIWDPPEGSVDPGAQPADPELAEPRPGGLGLRIVDQLARRWGAERPDGYLVWAELALPS